MRGRAWERESERKSFRESYSVTVRVAEGRYIFHSRFTHNQTPKLRVRAVIEWWEGECILTYSVRVHRDSLIVEFHLLNH